MGDPGVGGQPHDVQQLAIPAGAQAHEYAEGLEIADIQRQTDIALEVQLEVVAEPAGRVQFSAWMRG